MSRRTHLLVVIAAGIGLGEPAPLEVPPGFRVAIEAHGLTDARDLRVAGNGALLLTSTAGSGMGYEIEPGSPGSPPAVMQVARLPGVSTGGQRFAAAADVGPLRWDADLAQVLIPDSGAIPAVGGGSLRSRAAWIPPIFTGQDISAVVADDGSVFVMDSRAGILYRLTPRWL